MIRHMLLSFQLAVVWAGGAAAQSCTAGATALAFGLYQPLSGASSDSTATVSVTCASPLMPASISYVIQLGTGNSGSYVSRALASAGARLPYQIYMDPAYLRVLGDGTSGTSTAADSYLSIAVPITRNHTAYGTIPAAQRAGIGIYADVLTVTIIY